MAGNDASADPSVAVAAATLLFGGLSTRLNDSANARASPTAAVCVQPGQCPSSLQPYDARSGTTAGHSTPDATAAAKHARHDAPSAVAARPEFFFSGHDAASSTAAAADPNGNLTGHASAAAASEQPQLHDGGPTWPD